MNTALSPLEMGEVQWLSFHESRPRHFGEFVPSLVCFPQFELIFFEPRLGTAINLVNFFSGTRIEISHLSTGPG